MSQGIFSRLFTSKPEPVTERDTPADYACPDCGSQDDLSVLFIVKARRLPGGRRGSA